MLPLYQNCTKKLHHNLHSVTFPETTGRLSHDVSNHYERNSPTRTTYLVSLRKFKPYYTNNSADVSCIAWEQARKDWWQANNLPKKNC
jgi:hypothetical protein